MLGALVFWVLFGWLAGYSFPFGKAFDLMLACFKGTISAKVNSLQQQLQRIDVVPQPNNQQQVQKLNNLESQAWLYEGILERLGAEPSANHERIARTLEALEYKRSEILQELEPRRPRSYRVLAGIQDSARVLLASQAEKDYEQLQKIVTNLVLFTVSRQPSQIILSEVINKLASEIAQTTNQISPYRLRLAYKIDELMRILSAKLVLGSDGSLTDSNYQALVNELRSRLKLLSKEFDSLLRAKQEDANELNRCIEEISSLTKNISALHRDLSNRDADIVALQKSIQNIRELAQEKQVKINELQNLIYDLKRELQSSAEINQEKQNSIAQLQLQVSQLVQERLTLNKKLKDISAYVQNKESEIEALHNEKSQLNSQKLDWQRQYQNLYLHYQHQINQISNLEEQLAKAKRVATAVSISEEEYQKISNQSEYVPVKGHYRNGTWVDKHYRRRPKR